MFALLAYSPFLRHNAQGSIRGRSRFRRHSLVGAWRLDRKSEFGELARLSGFFRVRSCGALRRRVALTWRSYYLARYYVSLRITRNRRAVAVFLLFVLITLGLSDR